MKNASKYADILKSLCRAFAKEEKAAPIQKMDPLRALVRGAMSYGVSDARADEAMRHIDREFVNINELRVATELEIQEMLGAKYPAIEQRVQMITRCLNAIFEKEHTLSLDRLRTISKRDARQYLRDLPDMNPFVEGYVMLFAFEGQAIPLDEEMLAYLREQGMFDEKTTVDEAQRFLESNVKAEECYDFYTCLRRLAMSDTRPRKKTK